MSKKLKTTIITIVIVIAAMVSIMWFTRVETTDLESQLNYSWENGQEVYNVDTLNELQ